MKKRFTLLSFMFLLALSACGKGVQEAPDTDIPVSGALSAVHVGLTLFTTSIPRTRSPALFGIYANMLLAGGLDAPVFAAKAGVEAQMRFNAPPTTDNLDDIYALLGQFAAILHVDVPDLLNRSAHRAQTLDAYAAGLQNITDRGTRRRDDLEGQIKDLKSRQQERRRDVSALEKEVKTAVNEKDFATAQSTQSALSDAQENVMSLELQTKELGTLEGTLSELIQIAEERIAALEANREILIAGLSVSDIPGVEDLGVIEGRMRGRRGGFNPFRGL